MNWNDLLLHQKIGKQGPILTKQNPDYLNKIKAKSNVINIVPTIKVAKLIKIFYDENEFLESDINSNHILKASRGSGLLLDLGKEKNILNIRKKITDWKNYLIRISEQSEFLIEEKIYDKLLGKNGFAIDYKFFCFHGVPKFFLCRNGPESRNFYYLDYSPIKITGKEVEKIDLEPMINIATKLSEPFPFVRIDLYNGSDGIYFGEYTFHVNAGKKEFSDDLELKFGSYWKEIV